MHSLTADEKSTTVMLYSRNKLVHGELVTNKDVRVSTLPRVGLPNYLHLWRAEILFLAGSAPSTLNYAEYFFPTERMIGFHLAPPSSEPLDYDSADDNRTMHPVNLIMGEFMLKAAVLLPPRADLASMLESAHHSWISVYDADISNPSMPAMPLIRVPMLLVNSTQVSLGIWH